MEERVLLDETKIEFFGQHAKNGMHVCVAEN